MVIELDLLDVALQRREEYERLQDEAERARARFHRAVRHLSVDGAPLREIAEALGLSHQRVHQIVGDADPVSADEVEHEPGELSCTFCDRNQTECSKLVAGPNVFVCDHCAKAIDRVSSGATDDELRIVDDATAKCRFCGKTAKRLEWVVRSSRPAAATICNECFGLVGDILTEEARKDAEAAVE